MSALGFEIVARDPASGARAGLLHTAHGAIPTPAFAPVATQGAVKGLAPEALEALGVPLLMTNAYHLAVRPGGDVVAHLGGLHSISGWRGPIMTDSGGYQVFSLAARRKVDADGVSFRSHVDGALHRFTPESVMALHAQLGGDLVMPLDVCTGDPADRQVAERDVETTVRWAQRARSAEQRADQLLYGIVQGGTFDDLRTECARAIASLGFEAYAVGGVSVGEPKPAMARAVATVVRALPDAAPRHLLGVGEPDDIASGISMGIDTFDCVVPTRWARHGAAMIAGGRLNVRNAAFARDPAPLDPACGCPTCKRFSRGALRHLILAREILGLQLLTVHNVHFVHRLVTVAREAILRAADAEARRDEQEEQ